MLNHHSNVVPSSFIPLMLLLILMLWLRNEAHFIGRCGVPEAGTSVQNKEFQGSCQPVSEVVIRRGTVQRPPQALRRSRFFFFDRI
jgi:hypothetical protein